MAQKNDFPTHQERKTVMLKSRSTVVCLLVTGKAGQRSAAFFGSLEVKVCGFNPEPANPLPETVSLTVPSG